MTATKLDFKSRCLHGLLRFAFHLALFVGLLVGTIGQRVTFKNLGYVLGPYPYFVLLSISAAFIPVFAIICSAIVLLTGGWLPESRTWHCLRIFTIVGICNGLQGAGMVFANPHVQGYLQALLQQAVIPMTFVLSLVGLASRYSRTQYFGVILIVIGLGLQLMPSVSSAGLPSVVDEPKHSGASTWTWVLIFLLAQLPVAVGAIIQERAFLVVPVNIFHMMFWASVSQFSALILLMPLDLLPQVGDASSPDQFIRNFAEAWRLVREGNAGQALLACVATMLLSQLMQALMVKHTSAAYMVLCMAFAVPASALAFTMPAIMGDHAERMAGATYTALALVFVGISFYRFGDYQGADLGGDSPIAPLLGEKSNGGLSIPLPMTPKTSATLTPKGLPGIGIIQSEYSNARHARVGIFVECTVQERVS